MAALVAEGQAHPLNSKPRCNEMMDGENVQFVAIICTPSFGHDLASLQGGVQGDVARLASEKRTDQVDGC
jgi:hypothetical protein